MSEAIIERNADSGVKAVDCRLTVSNNRITANGKGMVLTACEGSVTGNSFVKNIGYGLHLGKSRVRLYGNVIEQNGGNGLEVEDGAALAWGNAITANGGYDCYNFGQEEFTAIANWWGGLSDIEVASRIYDRQADGRRGKVQFLPLLRSRPAAVR